MITKQLILFLLLSIVEIYPQLIPDSFDLYKNDNHFNKISDANPVSNSIGEIITIEDTIWIGTSRGVSVSFDRGESWTNFYKTPPFGEDGISAIGYYNGTFWAATSIDVEITGGANVPKGTGLKYTTNNGQTWNSIPQPLDNLSDTIVVYGINQLAALPITVAEQSPTYDFAFTPGAVWITSWASGLRRSTDMGQTWQRMVLPSDSLNSIQPTDTLDFCYSPASGNFCSSRWLNHVSFSVIASNDSTVYVGTANGINKTTNAGTVYPGWVKFNHLNETESISGNFVNGMAYNFTTNTIWASTWKAEGETEFYAISSSTDGGQSWKNFLEDERPLNFAFKNEDVIVASSNGAFRSSNQGTTWILPNNIFDKNSGVTLNTTDFFSAAAVEGDGYWDIWLGSGDGLARLRETGFWQGDWKIFLASQSLTSERSTYCYPNPYSPKLDQLKIKYSTGGKDASVTIRVFDFGMNYIRTILQNAPRNKTISSPPDYWDGRDDNGKLLPNGVYLYRVDVNDEDPLFGKIIYLQ